MKILTKLLALANKLDKKGAFEEADEIDALVKKMGSRTHINALIRALKEDKLEAAKNLMSHISPADLGLTSNDYKDLMIFLKNKDLDRARGLLGIVKGNPDADLGRPTVSPDLKDVFIEKREPEEGMLDLFSGEDVKELEDKLKSVLSADDGQTIKIRDLIKGKV